MRIADPRMVANMPPRDPMPPRAGAGGAGFSGFGGGGAGNPVKGNMAGMIGTGLNTLAASGPRPAMPSASMLGSGMGGPRPPMRGFKKGGVVKGKSVPQSQKKNRKKI